MAGQVTGQRIVISDSCNYEGTDLQSETSEVDVSGDGDLSSWVAQTLNVDFGGEGNDSYYGSPIASREISGSGEMNGLGEQ